LKLHSGCMCLPSGAVLFPSGTALDFSGPALVMAIINCNGDSFYAPSRALGEEAVEKALSAEKEGAAIVDFGAESSRPGALYINEEEELERLIPVISSFRKRSSLPVSADTRRSSVAAAAIDAGADIINDISALSDDPRMALVCAEKGAAVVLMHKKGEPLTMQENPSYLNLAEEINAFFKDSIKQAITAGIPHDKIILDPGIGFGKGFNDNLQIIRLLAKICGKDYPILVGLSRKSFIGEITSRHGVARDAEDRLAGTLAANAAAILAGADIIRVHDVKEHVDLAKVLFSITREQ
jgi:dihydropteroate synthase